MSRIGKLPINIPAGVTVTVENSVVTVKGPKGTLTQTIDPAISIEIEGAVINVTRPDDEKTKSCKPRIVSCFDSEHGYWCI